MGLLSFFGLKKREAPISFQDYVRNYLDGIPTASGQTVTVDSSFGIPAMWAGFRILGHTMASLPLEVFEISKDGSHPAYKHPLYDILTRQPTGLYNAFSFKEMMQINLESWGNAYARIYRSDDGDVTELEWLDPGNVTVMINRKNRVKKYKIRYTDSQEDDEILDHNQIIHLMIMSKDGIIGQSPINACKESLGMMIAAQRYGSSLYANGAQLSGLLSTDASLKQEQVDDLKDLWRANYQGVKNSGSVAILHSGAKYQAISARPVDLDFVKTMMWNAEQVAQILGIPPHMIGLLERSTNNNIEVQSLEFEKHTIRARVKCWEVELNSKLFLTPLTRKKHFIRYNVDGLLRGDSTARAALYQALWNMGGINADEIREKENMNALPDGIGKTYFRPLNMVDASQKQPIQPQNQPENGE